MRLRYLLFWFPLTLVAIANGVLRESTYGHWLNELHSHQLSTLTGMALIGFAVWTLLRRWPLTSRREALVVGGLWVIQTVLFEFLFGHYGVGHPWERLLDDYNLAAGRLWVLFLLWLALLPTLCYHLASPPSPSD